MTGFVWRDGLWGAISGLVVLLLLIWLIAGGGNNSENQECQDQGRPDNCGPIYGP